MAQLIFFFTFLITNASNILTIKASPDADKEKVERRKTQATLSLIISSVLFVLFVGLRKYFTACETWLGIVVGLVSIAPLAYTWYDFAKACSARDADIFGIIPTMLPDGARDEPPMTCVYTG